jgi:hypothetical protein
MAADPNESDDGPSIFLVDGIIASLKRHKQEEDTDRRLYRLLDEYETAPPATRWRAVYEELLTQFDTWIRGTHRGELGPQELALVPLAMHYEQLHPASRLASLNIDAHLESLRRLYHSPELLARLSRGRESEAYVWSRVLPAIAADSHQVPADDREAVSEKRLELYMTSLHVVWWASAAASFLVQARAAPAAPEVPPELHPQMVSILRSGSEVMRVQAQTLFIAMCIPFCTEPVQRRRTGEPVYDLWRTRFSDPSVTEQVNYCLRRCRGLEWLEEDELELEDDEEDAIDAGLDMRMPHAVDAVDGAADPLSAVIRRRDQAKRAEEQKNAHVAAVPTDEMKRWCEDAWIFMAWASLVDSQCASRDTSSYALATFQQCLVQPQTLGGSVARNKFYGEPYSDVRRLPTIIIVSAGVYVYRCHVCRTSRRCRDARDAVDAWFSCVRVCYHGRDGFGARIR